MVKGCIADLRKRKLGVEVFDRAEGYDTIWIRLYGSRQAKSGKALPGIITNRVNGIPTSNPGLRGDLQAPYDSEWWHPTYNLPPDRPCIVPDC